VDAKKLEGAMEKRRFMSLYHCKMGRCETAK
jgi:hypothetical protein